MVRQSPCLFILNPFLLRLADFFCGTNALEKTGTLRQHTPTGLPFSKFPARAETPLENLDGGPCSACGGSDALANIGARRQQQLPPSAAGSGRCGCPRPHFGYMTSFTLFHGIAPGWGYQNSAGSCIIGAQTALPPSAGRGGGHAEQGRKEEGYELPPLDF